MSTTPTPVPGETKTAADRRDNYRVDTPVRVRLRSVDTPGGRSKGGDPVAAFEELALAAARYRKELSNAGRLFVDRVVDTLDCLTASLAAKNTDHVWGAPRELEANVSAAGIGFTWSEELAVGSLVEVEFAFEGEGSSVPFTFVSEVRRSIAIDDGWSIGLAFQGLTQVSQQRLIRQIYDVQRLDLRGRASTS